MRQQSPNVDHVRFGSPGYDAFIAAAKESIAQQRAMCDDVKKL
jgi:hypothetical protein